VRLTPILDAVAQYNGDAWWLPISDRVRNSLDKTRFHQFVLDYQRTKFDLLGSIRAAEIIIPMLHLNKRLKIIYQEDLSKLFCSELICAAFREAGAIQSINASEVTPADLCMFSVYSGQYFQLKDDRDKALNGYNSQNPEGFGVVR
jgi:hypothetical protein